MTIYWMVITVSIFLLKDQLRFNWKIGLHAFGIIFQQKNDKKKRPFVYAGLAFVCTMYRLLTDHCPLISLDKSNTYKIHLVCTCRNSRNLIY